jgi:hypothetical protein
MPKRKEKLTQAEQSERFRRDAQRLIDAGELDPIEAERAVDALIQKSGKPSG